MMKFFLCFFFTVVSYLPGELDLSIDIDIGEIDTEAAMLKSNSITKLIIFGEIGKTNMCEYNGPSLMSRKEKLLTKQVIVHN